MVPARPFVSISSLIPDADHLLALEVEELAGVLLVHVNSVDQGAGTSVFHNGRINYHNFFNALRTSPDYGGKQGDVNMALMEAWVWLENEGFLVRDPGEDNSYFISRRGKRLKDRDEFAAYLKANLLPKHQLHPLIAGRVYPAFLRGDYDTAIFQAFREVEIAVRTAIAAPADLVGVQLMRKAFSAGGALVDPGLPAGEQDGMSHLFAGAFGVYRNSTGHRYVPTKPEEAAEVIMFSSQLLRIVDRLSPPKSI